MIVIQTQSLLLETFKIHNELLDAVSVYDKQNIIMKAHVMNLWNT